MIPAAVFVGLVSFALPSLGEGQAEWKEFVTRDGSMSFQYPADWTANQRELNVHFSRASTREEIFIGAFPFDAGMTPLQYANVFATTLRNNLPGMLASKFNENGGQVQFEIAYRSEDNLFAGVACLNKRATEAVWSVYTAPIGEYRVTGALLLRTMLASVARKAARSAEQTPAASGAGGVRSNSALIGSWVDHFGGNGVTFVFRADGTCQQGVVMTDGVIRGVGSDAGTYSLTGNLLTIHQTRSTWKPYRGDRNPGYDKAVDEIRRYRIRRLDPQTLILFDEKLGIENNLSRSTEPR